MNVSRYFTAVLCAIVFLAPALTRAQTFPPVWNPTANYEPGDLVTDYGNYYRCLAAVTNKPYRDPSKYYTSWQLYYVRNNTTLIIGVGQTFPSLAVAWSNIQNCQVAQGAYLHLDIVTSGGNFNESFSAPFSLDQISGANISIIGDSESNIHLSFPNSNGFVVDTSHAFGTISNLSLTGSIGIYATTGASISWISFASINGSYIGISSTLNASLSIDGTVTVGNPSYACFYADQGGTMFLYDSSVNQGSGVNITGPGRTSEAACFYADHNATISVSDPIISEFGRGAWAEDGAVISLLGGGGEVQNCGTGLKADLGGRIWADNTLCQSNGTDLKVFQGGTIYGNSTLYTTTSVGSGDGSYIWN